MAAPVALGEGVVESIMSSLDCILEKWRNRSGVGDWFGGVWVWVWGV